MKTDLSNFSGWVIYEKGTIVATYDKENFHRYYDQEEIRILQQENKQLKEELEILKDAFDFNLGAIENIRKGKNKLEDKIDKTIDFIKENANYDISIKQCRDNLFDCECDDLLEILGDKE